MNTQTEQLDDRPWYQQFWPWFLFFWPAAVVVAGIVMVTLATQTPVSLVKTDYYKEGLKINENLAAAELAAELGVQAELTMAHSYMRVDLNGVYADSLRLSLIHPTASKSDKEYVLQPVGARRFEAVLNPNEFVSDDGAEYRIQIEGESEPGLWVLSSASGNDRFMSSLWHDTASGFHTVLRANNMSQD